MDADRRAALELVPVSRETETRLALFVALLRRWQQIQNLVGPSTLDRVWTRHVADSAQILALAPAARCWADLGTGAGFPGMVIAIQLAGVAGASVHLIEANARKCAFLREVARQCGAPAHVHNGRIEGVLPTLQGVEVLTARALAPLRQLLDLGRVQLDRGASGIFLKSRVEIDSLGCLEGGQVSAGGRVSVLPSRTSVDGRIVVWRASGSPGEATAVAERVSLDSLRRPGRL